MAVATEIASSAAAASGRPQPREHEGRREHGDPPTASAPSAGRRSDGTAAETRGASSSAKGRIAQTTVSERSSITFVQNSVDIGAIRSTARSATVTA